MTDYLNKLRELGITRTTSGKQKCPNCIASKKDKSAQDLSVTFQSDRVLYQCHNGCGFTGVVFMHDLKTVPKKTFKRPEPPQAKDNKEKLYEYWGKRGISKETVDKFGLQINDKNQIIFPYYKGGELVNHKYRWHKDGKKRFMQDKEAEQVFYGMDLITDFSRLIICEGEPDVLTFAEIGIESVSVPQGATEDKLECIENCYEWLQQFDEYIICVDNDPPWTPEQIAKDPKLVHTPPAGDKLRKNLLNRLDKSKCKIAMYQLQGANGLLSYKDANEAFTQCEWGKTFLEIVIDSAEPVPIENIITFSDVKESTLDFFRYGMTAGYSTGWDNADKLISLHLGHFMVVTGRPSAGKSRFWKNTLLNLTEKYDLKHLIFDRESRIEKCNITMASMLYRKYERGYNGLNEDDLIRSMDKLSNNFKFLPRIHDWTIDEILDKGKECAKRYGINTLTIDPFNKVRMDCSAKDIRLYVRDFLNKCIDFGIKYNVLVCVVAHPTKPVAGVNQVGLYNISESADWANMSDYGIICHRDYVEEKWSNETKIITEKIKEDHMGNMGSCKLTMGVGRFTDLETKYNEPTQRKVFGYE